MARARASGWRGSWSRTLNCFAGLARGRDDAAFAEVCSSQASVLRSNIEAQAWDGEWYRRAYFDDGTPLGSSSNDECQIDSISQSWAVISKGGDPVRARQAMAAVDQRLVRRDKQIIQLLDPPFDKSDLEPGYIKGYIPACARTAANIPMPRSGPRWRLP